MNKKSICICTSQVPFVKGGNELLVSSLYEQIKKRNFNVDVVSIPFKWYPKNEILNSIFMWRLLDLSESNGKKIDLVIATKFPSYVINHENKVTWLVHQFRQVYDQYGTEYSEFRNCEEDSSLIKQIINIDNKTIAESKKIFTIANNVKDRLFKYNNIQSQTLYHPPKHIGKYYCSGYNDYILSVGRLESVKRIDMLINSLKYCDERIKAVIAGIGPQQDYLKKLAQQIGISDRVEFLGFVEDDHLLQLYAEAFSVYFAPYDEDYGYITLEAFLSKKPIITCRDSGGVLEFVDDNISGYICDKNPELIGQAIQNLWINKKMCVDFGEEGFSKVKNITWDYVIDRLTEKI